MKNTGRVKFIEDAIRKTAKELGKSPLEITKRDLSDLVSDHDFRVAGGLKLAQNAFFSNFSDRDVKGIVDAKERVKLKNKTENKLGKTVLFEDQLLETLAKHIKPIKVKTTKLQKGSKQDREVVVSLNDTHYGCIVKPEEVGYSNRFDWEVACRRTAFLAQQVIDYKIEKRKDVKCLHIVINGDVTAGAIHDLTARTAELLALQQIGAMHILSHFISAVAQHYPKVVVHGIAGNHDDSVHRREHGHRVTSHKYDSVVAPIFAALSLSFKGNKDISFNFPKSLYIDIDLIGGRACAAHGDTLFSKQLGNPGTSLNIAGLSDAINRFNTGEINRGKKPFKLMLFGHVHNHVNFTTFDGIKVYIPPSLSGIDAFAHSLAINNNLTGQLIFESTKNHILGDPRLVDLLCADNDASLDSIIPVYQNQLSLKGEG